MSLVTAGRLAVRGVNVAAQTRDTKNVKRLQLLAGSADGFTLA